jgi:hypothetical protein
MAPRTSLRVVLLEATCYFAAKPNENRGNDDAVSGGAPGATPISNARGLSERVSSKRRLLCP